VATNGSKSIDKSSSTTITSSSSSSNSSIDHGSSSSILSSSVCGTSGGSTVSLRVADAPPARLDYLFLDTTYCDPQHNFPSQAAVVDATAALLQRVLADHNAVAATAAAAKQARFFATLHAASGPALPAPRPGWGSLVAAPRAAPPASGAREQGRLLVLFGAYSIGKERLYLAVAARLGLRVRVDASRLRTLQCLGWPPEEMARLTTNPLATPLWVVPLGHVTFEGLASYAADGHFALPAHRGGGGGGGDHGGGSGRGGSGSAASAAAGARRAGGAGPFDTVVGVRPTGWTHGKGGAKGKGGGPGSSEVRMREQRQPRGLGAATAAAAACGGGSLVASKPRLVVLDAPYSEHSSFPELVDCVAALRPVKVVPTVNCSSAAAVQKQLDLLLAAPQCQSSTSCTARGERGGGCATKEAGVFR
jgi:DNA cross-link repair 1A protein